jgi:hypothetical protein
MTIHIEKTASGYQASVSPPVTGACGFGRTPANAVGDLIYSYPNTCGVAIHNIDPTPDTILAASVAHWEVPDGEA